MAPNTVIGYLPQYELDNMDNLKNFPDRVWRGLAKHECFNILTLNRQEIREQIKYLHTFNLCCCLISRKKLAKSLNIKVSTLIYYFNFLKKNDYLYYAPSIIPNKGFIYILGQYQWINNRKQLICKKVIQKLNKGEILITGN